MDLERAEIDLPFSVRVYEGGYLGLAYDTTIHGVDIYVHGTIEHPRNITMHSGGEVGTALVTSAVHAVHASIFISTLLECVIMLMRSDTVCVARSDNRVLTCT